MGVLVFFAADVLGAVITGAGSVRSGKVLVVSTLRSSIGRLVPVVTDGTLLRWQEFKNKRQKVNEKNKVKDIFMLEIFTQECPNTMPDLSE
ncbi:MAG: hypothetical protein JWN76_2262 [Chitinophagaceae bacterium]|nr:hypothetical protein [Chitinophagaceae bacterium]